MQDFLFKYYYEVDRIVRKEDARAVLVPAEHASAFGNAEFSRNSIKAALKQDNVDVQYTNAIKYFDKKR